MPTTKPKAPEQRTIDVDVEDIDSRGRTLHGYAAVYGSVADLGDFRETISRGAFANVLDADVRALLNHDPNEVLGRTKSGTLRLFDEARGLRFEIDVPDSPLGENVKAAVKRGDIDGASFRFQVGDEEWSDDLRTIKSVTALHDVTLATYPAYPDSSVELRSRNTNNNATRNEADKVSDESKTEERSNEQRSEETEERKAPEVKVVNEPAPALKVEDRAQSPAFASLADAFEQRGFPAQTATLGWNEFRALSFGGTVTDLSPVRRDGGPLGADQRFAFPAFQSIAVGSDVTSVQVFSQSARTLGTATDVIRNIDATSTKPSAQTAGTVTSVPLRQVAAIESGIPNVYLESQGMASIVETDLRLTINGGLDSLVQTGLNTSGTVSKGTFDVLNAVRRAVTAVTAGGYEPSTLLIDPAGAEALDLFRDGASPGVYTFGAGRFSPSQLFGLDVRVWKLAGTAVVDSAAYGKLYVSPISLARFEESAGATNTSTVRLEGHAAFGTERTAAAARVMP
jgi:uncharacterized protein